MKYLAAYKTGKLLGQLNWHLTQSCLGVRQHEPLLRDVYMQLICEARGVVEVVHNQDTLESKIIDMWNGLDVDVLFSDTWDSRLKELQSRINKALCLCNIFQLEVEIGEARNIRNGEVSVFLNPVITFIKNVREMIELAVQNELAVQENPDAVDRVSRSLRFGEFVNQALYPHEVAQHMFRPWSWDEWGRSLASRESKDLKDSADLEGSSRAGFVKKPTRRSAFGRKVELNELQCLGTGIDPGELPVLETWFAELRKRWGEFQFGTLPAEIEQLVATEPPSGRSSVRSLPRDTIATLVTSIDCAFQSHADAATSGVTVLDTNDTSSKDLRKRKKGGRSPLPNTDPKVQVYSRIKLERKPNERSAKVRERLEADKDFMDLFRAANLKWKNVFNRARAYFARPRN